MKNTHIKQPVINPQLWFKTLNHLTPDERRVVVNHPETPFSQRVQQQVIQQTAAESHRRAF